jgi:hypothetical protein
MRLSRAMLLRMHAQLVGCHGGDDMTITNQQLRETFLTPAMQHYFARKLPHLSDAELNIRIEETLKFLAIAPQCSGSIPVSKEIDEIWHYWILQTQEYEQLCLLLPTAVFIHHSSNAYMESVDSKLSGHDSLLSHVKMLAAYVANYGPFEESRVKFWTLASELCEKCHWSTHDLNAWLTERR